MSRTWAECEFAARVFWLGNAPYVWVGCPAGLSSWDMFDKMLGEAQVVITPGSGFGFGFGSAGEGYFRISAFNSRANKLLQFRSRIDWSLSNLVALLRWNLFTHKDLWKWIDDPFIPPPEPPPSCRQNWTASHGPPLAR